MSYEIPLTSGRVARIDEADAPLVEQYVWSLEQRGGNPYAVCYLDPSDLNRCIRMHRLIMQPQPQEVVDHIDGDGLNNQRSNLRVCTQQQNSRNLRKTRRGSSSRYKGVSRCSDRDKWRAQIRIDGKNKLLGYFDDEAEAARGYDAAARRHYGEFARSNFEGDDS